MLALAAAIVAATSATAHATYSIVAVDASTMQVGGTGASCVGSAVSIYSIYGSVPGHGAVHAQALLSSRGRDLAVGMMEMDEPLADILTAITDPTFDSQYDRRQYGLVDLAPEAIGFTGASTFSYADDVQGTESSYTYSAQGNILTSAAVLDQASAAFEAEGCDLAERLMRALEAGAEDGEGDSRCTPSGIPADGAFIQVDRPDEARGSWLSLRVDDTSPEDPVALLRAEFDAWRETHPCPEVMPDAGPPDAGASDDGGPSDAGLDAGATRTDSGVITDRSRDRGCGCSIPGGRNDDGRHPGWSTLGAAAVVLVLRRRRRR